MKRYVVSVLETSINDYVVRANTPEQAMSLIGCGDFTDVGEVQRLQTVVIDMTCDGEQVHPLAWPAQGGAA